MKILKRDDIDEKFKWNLNDIIDGDEEWTRQFKQVATDYKTLADYQGKLDNAENILKCLKHEEEIGAVVESLYTYAKMKQDEDGKVTKYQAMTNKIEQLSVDISSISSYVLPELNKLQESQLSGMARMPEFADYDYFLNEIIRMKQHILSEKEEKILSEVGSFSDIFHDAFSMFDDVDITFDKIKNGENEIELSHGVYSLCMQNDDRTIRKAAFESMFNSYKNMINTITQLYVGNVKKDCFYAKVRGHKSAMDKALFNENVDGAVYQNLCESVHETLPCLHDYIALRKNALGYNELHSYDMHVAIVEGESIQLEYEKACQVVKEALKPLGEEYAGLLDKSFNNKWIDVFENKGKRSGAYSWGCYNSHPYVLLNYQKTTHDVFTIAHELGHAMHSYYSNKTQPQAKAGYEIFVAEVASTVNEVLLLKYLISKAEPKLKKYLLSYYLDMFRTTMFRQTQFAEFELLAHKMVEDGEPITPEALCDIYAKLNSQYYGNELVADELIAYEWARIPHFYRSFYVYKYATGIVSAVKIASDILKYGDSAVEKYKKFLSLGGSMSPVDILKVAGVDLTSKQPFKEVKIEIETTLAELKKYF